VKSKYREVAAEPHRGFHFHTGRPLARRLGYDPETVDALPDAAVESFAGVANPFASRLLEPGEKVVDAGSGAGFDCFIVASQVGETGQVVGVDMLAEMLTKSRNTAADMSLTNVDFREGLLEALPVEDGWADVVISNGVFNLCADKKQVFTEVWRVLRPGGRLQFGDIASRCPSQRLPTSICGLLESLEAFRVKAGWRCCGRWGARMYQLQFMHSKRYSVLVGALAGDCAFRGLVNLSAKPPSSHCPATSPVSKLQSHCASWHTTCVTGSGHCATLLLETREAVQEMAATKEDTPSLSTATFRERELPLPHISKPSPGFTDAMLHSIRSLFAVTRNTADWLLTFWQYAPCKWE
jgi:SAM-dependent methyltransferase